MHMLPVCYSFVVVEPYYAVNLFARLCYAVCLAIPSICKCNETLRQLATKRPVKCGAFICLYV